MGNRAVITFDQNRHPDSLGIYLHWNGGAESVLAFLEACNKLEVRDDSDPSYQAARLVQIIGNFFGGTCSVGVDTLENLDCDNGDNGIFVVTRNGSEITMQNAPDLTSPLTTVDLEKVKKSPYWNPKEGKDILTKILDAQGDAFKCG